MIERYATPEMTRIWSDEFKLSCWISIEIDWLHCLISHKRVTSPPIPTIVVKDNDGVVYRISGKEETVQIFLPVFKQKWLELEEQTHHDVVAFVNALEEELGDAGRFIHFAMTSSDLCDTALAMQMNMAMKLIEESLLKFKNVLIEKADEYRKTPIIGRTHGMWAEPTSFGLVLLTYVEEINRHTARISELYPRLRVGKMSGAVGTCAHMDPSMEDYVLRRLGLAPEPVASQVVHRDRHAEAFNLLAMIGATIERLAIEIRHLSRSEVREVSEPFGKKQKGSSAMPHKKNPIKSENLTGLARILRANAGAAMENIALWHQRDISHSSVERFIGPDSFGILHFMLERITKVMEGLVVNTDEMLARVEYALPNWRSQMDMLELVGTVGVPRKEAHDRMQSGEKLLIMDTQKMIDYHLKHVDAIFRRVNR